MSPASELSNRGFRGRSNRGYATIYLEYLHHGDKDSAKLEQERAK